MLEVERETAIGSVTFLDPTLGRPTYLSAKPITSASMPTSVMRAIRLKKELPRRWRSSHCELGLQRGQEIWIGPPRVRRPIWAAVPFVIRQPRFKESEIAIRRKVESRADKARSWI
jgi:hypothetical protein